MLARIRTAIRRVLTDRRGFTLVEMLIVIAIIGILAAIAVPSFSRVTARAKEKACAANVATLQRLVDLYLVDNPGKALEDLNDINVLKPYLDNDTLPSCPVSSGAEYRLDNGVVKCSHGE